MRPEPGLALIRLVDGGRLAEVILDNPPANALSHQLMDELDQVMDWLEAGEAQVVVLRTAQRMFMAGADLNMVDGGWASLSATIAKAQALMSRWEALPMMTVAAITGHALGAGCELALACDWRLMVEAGAKIGLPEVLRALLPGAGGTQRMLRLVGRPAALDMCLRGRMIEGADAAQLGLVSEAISAEAFDRRLDDLTAELLALPRLPTQAIKRCVVGGLDGSLAEGLALERREMVALGDTEDTREGVRAFVEKREPRFVGR